MKKEQKKKNRKKFYALHPIPYVLTFVLVLLFLQCQSYASKNYIWTEGDYTIPYLGWSGADVLDTYNNVTVTMPGGGAVGGTFNMHDSSILTISGGHIGELNLYDNALASIFYGGDDINYLFVDSASTALVKLYATEIGFDGYTLYFNWLYDTSHDIRTINLIGSSTYSHIQFIPEPATIALLGAGFFAIRKSRKR